ncbi:MAG: hypothetical protein IJT48_12195 [Bacteroidaceae bacterium]|nr:hypothetical protein [Bacteroidaceae bacterium]
MRKPYLAPATNITTVAPQANLMVTSIRIITVEADDSGWVKENPWGDIWDTSEEEEDEL